MKPEEAKEFYKITVDYYNEHRTPIENDLEKMKKGASVLDFYRKDKKHFWIF